MQNLLSLHVLLIEDNPSDALLLQRNLEMDRISRFTFTHVERLSDGLNRLEGEKFDAILLDLGLPDSVGLEGFEKLHKQFPDLPVVVFSGNDDEEQAVRAVRSGAQDYLVKSLSGFEMAARTIRYGIERQRAQHALHQSEARYQSVLDSMLEGFQIIGYDWRYLYVNKAVTRQGRRAAQELLGHTMMEMYPGIEHTPLFAILRECMDTRAARRFENQFIFPDGSTGWFELSIQPAEQGLLILSNDITERKQIESQIISSRKLAQETIDALSAHICVIDETGTIISVNRSWRDFADANPPASSDYWMGANYLDVCERSSATGDPDAEATARGIRAVIRGEISSFQLEYACHSSTHKRWFILRVTRFEANAPLRVVITHENITERKLVEENLRESEERYKMLFDANPHPMWVYDLETLAFLMVNDAAVQHYGYSREEFLGMTILDIRPPEDHHRLLENIAAVKEGVDEAGIWTHQKKDGTLISVEITSHTLDFAGRKAKIVLANDVTDRLLAERSLKETEERLELVLDGSQLGYWDWNIETGKVNRNERWAEMLGYTLDDIELNVKQWTDLHHPDDRERAWASIQDHLEGRTPAHRIEYRMRTKDGSYKWILDQARVVKRDAQGRPLRMSGTHTDITERKQVELRLKRNERVLRLFVEHSPAAIAMFDVDMRYIVASRRYLADYGLGEQDLTGRSHYEVFPELPERWKEINRRCLNGAIERAEADPFLRLDGHTDWVHWEVHPWYEEKGKVGGIILFSEVVTERIGVQEALRQSDERYQQFISQSFEAISRTEFDQPVDTTLPVETQIDQIYTHAYLAECNQAMAAMYGFDSPADLIGKRFKDMHRVEDEPVNRQAFREFIANGYRSLDAETLEFDRHGNPLWFLNNTVGTIVNGKLVRLWGTSIEITARKRAEHALKESEEKYRTLINAMGDGMFVAMDEMIVFSNPALSAMLGYEPGEFNNIPFAELVASDHLQVWTERFHKRTAGEAVPSSYHTQFLVKGGRERIWIELRANRILYEGQPAVLGIARDITEQKRVEMEIRQVNERFTQLADHIADIFWISDPATRRSIYVSPAFERIVGRSVESVAQLPDGFLDVLIPEDRHILAQAREQENGGLKTETQYRIRRPDGTVRWIRDKGSPVFDETGRVVRVVGIARDITEQVDAEHHLRESEARFRSLFEFSNANMLLIDAETGRIEDANPSAVAFYGYPREELIGMDIATINQLLPGEVAVHRQKAAKKEQNHFEFPHRLANGQIRVVDVGSSPIQINGRSLLFSIIYDITERKQAEELVLAQRDLSRAFSQVTSLDIGARLSLETALRVSHLDSGGIYLFNDVRDTLELIHHQGLGPEFVQAVQSYPLDAPNVQLIMGGKSLILSPKVIETEILYQKEGLLSLVVIPIVYQERVIGCLNVASHTQTRVPMHAIQALETIAIEIGSFVAYLRTEASLRESEINFRYIADTINEVFWMADAEVNKIIYISPGYERVWGRSLQSLYETPRSFLDAILPEDQERALSMLAAQKTGMPFDLEYRIRHTNGSIRTVWDRGYPVRDENGRVIRYVGVAQDITERKQAEYALRESEDRYRSAITAADAIPYALDYSINRYTFVGEGIEKLTGIPAGEFTPSAFADLHQESIVQGDLKGMHIMEAMLLVRQGKAGSLWKCDHLIETRSGEMRWCSDAAIQIVDENGIPVGSIGIMQDITERKEIELALRARTEDLTRLLETGRALSETLDTQQIYGIIFNAVKAALPCDMLIASSFDSQAELLTCQYLHTTEGPQDVSGFPPIPLEPPGQGTQSLVARSGESLLLPDYERALKTAQTSYEFNEHGEILEDAPADEERVRSAILVPLKVEGKVAGVLQVFSFKRNVHTEDHLRFVETLAFHASASLSNARLFAEMEERVKQRTAEVQDLYENAPTGYHSLDINGRFILINQTELNWLGYTREEMIGRPFFDFATEQSMAVFHANFPGFKERGWVRNLEFEFIRKDGSTFPILVSATAIYDKDGNYLMSRSTVFDNTERKLAEDALRESEEQNRLLFEETPDAVVLFDEHGGIKRLNRAFELMTGFTIGQLADHTLDSLGMLTDTEVALLTAAVVQSLKVPDEFATAEFRLKRADNEYRDVSARVFGVKIFGLQHYLATMRDVTIEKQVQETLRLANAELERSLRLKDEFLANMSHELRTPLNAILGMSESLLEQVSGPLNAKQQKYLQTVAESGRHLLELINDILDLAKINAGKIDLDMNRVDVANVAQSSLRMVRELAHKKEQHIDISIDPNVTLAWADERRLKQMLVNLLSNAVKFTEPGGRLGLEIKGNRSDNILHFTVWDTGIGIRQEDMSHLFQPFVQLDSGLARGAQGTGLGLVLVSQMARLHGGSVSVESEEGRGSRFTISIPWIIAAPMSVGAGPGAKVETSRARPIVKETRPTVLLVEDTEAVTMLISDYLERYGFHVVTARDGFEGLKLSVQAHPDIILMDVMMPDMDGLETTRRIRSELGMVNVPIIALTALAMPGDRDRCLAAGMNDYLSKPVKLQDLLDMIKSHLSTQRGGSL